MRSEYYLASRQRRRTIRESRAASTFDSHDIGRLGTLIDEPTCDVHLLKY